MANVALAPVVLAAPAETGGRVRVEQAPTRMVAALAAVAFRRVIGVEQVDLEGFAAARIGQGAARPRTEAAAQMTGGVRRGGRRRLRNH